LAYAIAVESLQEGAAYMPNNRNSPDLEMKYRFDDSVHAAVNNPDLCAVQMLKVFRRPVVGNWPVKR
jgi:hypothetical protein